MMLQLFNNIPEQLYPYDRESETLISVSMFTFSKHDLC